MQLRRTLAGIAFLVLVPGLIALAYLGARAGYYQQSSIPIVFGGTLICALAVLFALLPRLD